MANVARFSEPMASSVAQFSELIASGLRRETISGASFNRKRVFSARYQLGELGDFRFSEPMARRFKSEASGDGLPNWKTVFWPAISLES